MVSYLRILPSHIIIIVTELAIFVLKLHLSGIFELIRYIIVFE